jgi:REP element-mobilizing transposase RayT
MDIFNRLNRELYFMTDTVIDWIDIFTRSVYKHIILESLQYCQEQKGLTIYAWVLMSNHLHT